ncbi:MAG TPA: phage virion morphogenesis protein [Azonexus sp.]|nr:phage virion morphogenesis protein [Azonexus sp.]
MADAITVRFESAPVLARLNEIARRIDNLSPAMRGIGELLAESTKERFSSSTGPDGQKWKALAPATVLARLMDMSGHFAAYSNVKTQKEGRVRVGDKKGYFGKGGRVAGKGALAVANMRPLVDTGMLGDTIRYQLTPGSNGVEIGTNRFSGEWEGGAAVHQFGSKDGNIPARTFLGLSASDEADVLEILDRFMHQAIQ